MHAIAPGPRRLPPEARRAALLLAAKAVFAEQGAGASFESIAIRAGVTRPLLYPYFASLDELYLPCPRTAREEFAASLADATAGAGTVEDKLRAGLHAHLRY